MKRIRRRPLPKKAFAWTVRQTKAILKTPESERKEAAKKLWGSGKQRMRKYKDELRETLRGMSLDGLCMYCEHNTPDPIEHFWPKSKYPEKAFCWDNLLLICDQCNRIKNDHFEVNAQGEALFVDPTRDELTDHFELSPTEGKLVPLGEDKKGENTSNILNQWALRRRRKEVWGVLQSLLVDYARARERGDTQSAKGYEEQVGTYPFTELLHFLLRASKLPDPERYLHVKGCLDAIRKHEAEILAWIEARQA